MRWKPLAAAFVLATGLLGPVPAALGTTETAPLANLDFEQGEVGQEPPGWFVPGTVKAKGYAATTVTERPESGARCAVLTAPAKPSRQDFGNLMRSFDATPYRGKRVRFRAAVRVEGEGDRAQLWLRVDRPGESPGFFDNMNDRPVTSAAWARYEIVGAVAADATTINFGLIHSGGGRAWLDSASFEVLGATGAGNEPARPLSPRGLQNLVAFTRLLGYVRYFHPSDSAANLGTDGWDRFALAGVQTVEAAAGPEELARTLTTLFLPIAPTVRVFPAGRPETPAETLAPAGKDPKARRVYWRHLGLSLGMEIQGGAYQSLRIDNQKPDKTPDGEALPAVPWKIDLPSPLDLGGGGVQAFVFPTLPTDDQGRTLPVVPDGVRPKAPDKPEGFLASGDDRATRLADVALAWNVFQHFYPYFDVVQADWPAELRRALKSAATDPDERAFRDTLSRLVAALGDGHGSVSQRPSLGSRQLPLLWEWVEDRLVVTQVDREHGGGRLAPGDVVTAIDGKPTAEVLAAAEALRSGATPQWRRYRTVAALAIGAPGSVRLTVEHPTGKTETVTVERSLPAFGPGAPEEKRPEKIAEVAPGVLYVDISRITDDDWKEALDRLAKAKGIVIDFRGYPQKLSPIFLQNLTDKPIQSAHWRIPVVTRPDRAGWLFHESHWNLQPLSPHLTARLAFVTDGRAISYAESCMGIVEAYKLGAIVGGPTAGTNGNINPFTLPGGYRLVWTGMQVLKHDGSRHHGVGILPTVPISRTRAGVAAGRDELLDKAIAVVSK